MRASGNFIAAAPVIQFNCFPLLRFGRKVTGIHDGIDHIAIVEGLHGRIPQIHGIEHIGEHKVIAKCIDFISHREQPAGGRLCLLCHIIAFTHSCVHIKAGTQEVVQENGSFHTHHLITKVHSSPETPAYLELTNSSRSIFNQSNGMVLCLDGLHLGIGPAHYLKRAHILSNIIPCNLDAVTAQVNDCPTT